MRARSQEFIIADATGLHKARSVRRLPLADRWPSDSIDIIQAVPWDFLYGCPPEISAEAQQADPISADSGERLPQPLAEGENEDAEYTEFHIDFKENFSE